MKSHQEANTVEPLVSVGIPTYNRPEKLRHTLECITGQAYNNLEIIISDNCSPGPDVEGVIREYLMKDIRIRYYRQKVNMGMSWNFYFVLDMAKGKYFFWLSDDDYVAPTFVSTLVTQMEKNTSVIVAMCATSRFDQNGDPDGVVRKFNTRLNLNTSSRIRLVLDAVNNDYFSYLIYGIYRTKMFRGFIKETPDYFAGDVMVVCQVLLAGRLYYVDEVLQFRQMYKVSTDVRFSDDPVGKRVGDTFKFYKKLYHLNNCLWRSSYIPLYRKLWIPVIIVKGLIFQVYIDMKRSLHRILAIRKKIFR